ncbi:MAG: hypothetical protein H6980_10140 [Gammaproteobacteria bacterium]|nr:hypothetical protein [Gammaproteobacteria bacterium]
MFINRKLIAATAAIVALTFSGMASALTYQIDTGAGWVNMSSLSSAQTAAQHYGPLNTGPGYAQSDTGFMWLHTNSNNGDVAWGTLLDVNRDTTSGRARVTLQGLPGSAYISLRDDGSEPGNISGGTLNAAWNWAGCCTDGVVINGMNGEWQVDVQLTSYTGINNWYFLTGDVNAPTQIALNDTFSVRAVNSTDVPLPAPAALFAVGAVALYRRRNALA